MFIDDERTEIIPERITQVMRAVQLEIMLDIIRRLNAVGSISRSADYQIQKLYQLGLFKDEVDRLLMNALDLSEKELNILYDEVIREGYARDETLYEHVGVPFTPLEVNETINQYIQAVYAQTKNEMVNITQTTGFVDFEKGALTPLNTYFVNVLDKGHAMIASGAFTKDQAIAKVIQDMTNSGLRTDRDGNQWVNYNNEGKRPHHNRMDVAVRRAIMTGVNQVVGKVTEYNAEKLETNYFEVSAHATARPSHQEWQGRVYTREQLQTVCGLGTVTGLQGANCYHHYDAFIPGVSTRVYSDEQLEEMKRNANMKRVFDGQEYTLYEATQRQRAMETRLRVLNQREVLFEAAGNKDKLMETQVKKRLLTNEYREFSKAMGLQEQFNRVYNPVSKSIFKDRSYEPPVPKTPKERPLLEESDKYSRSTKEWVASDKEEGSIKDSYHIDVDGVRYDVDNRHVMLDYSKYEKEVAESIAFKYKKDVVMLPRVLFPEGVQTPDYLIDGIGYDLKTITSENKNTIYNAVRKKKKQASNFVIDVSSVNIGPDEITSAMWKIFHSDHTRFVYRIVIVKDGEVTTVFKRK